jgi:hypothetical protein
MSLMLGQRLVDVRIGNSGYGPCDFILPPAP